jgi:hypothetical protein
MARTATVAKPWCRWCETEFDGRGFSKHQDSCEKKHRIKHQTKEREKARRAERARSVQVGFKINSHFEKDFLSLFNRLLSTLFIIL